MIIHFKGKHLLICLSSILSQVFCAFLRKRMQTSQKLVIGDPQTQHCCSTLLSRLLKMDVRFEGLSTTTSLHIITA